MVNVLSEVAPHSHKKEFFYTFVPRLKEVEVCKEKVEREFFKSRQTCLRILEHGTFFGTPPWPNFAASSKCFSRVSS